MNVKINQKVLIVDDAPSDVKVLKEVLRREHQVFFATCGDEALQVALARHPDLILLDVFMPGMDGHEVCRRLKRDPETRDIPVIFVTGMVEEEDESVGFALGAVDFITKPFRPELVRMRVRNHLELKRQRDVLHSLSLFDGLTSLPNRRAFDERLDAEWRRAWRHRWSISLLIADIDYFKGFNDRHGHLAGDECLRQVGLALASSIQRAEDFVARYGGEEFACVLPDTDVVGAWIVAEAMRESVEKLKLRHEAVPSQPWVTVSVGVASAHYDTKFTPEAVLARADALLYEAKRAGRNRILAASYPVERAPC